MSKSFLVTCLISVLHMTPKGTLYRGVDTVKGIERKENDVNLYVDFEKEFRTRGVDFKLNTAVQWVNANSCLYKKVGLSE